ncbi:MAG: GNAT family N-acetyltransferase [Syntrophales bacterium]|nr:GNAT family N-acetyltransferase [Syntrophales bacterium]
MIRMNLRIQEHCENIDWELIRDALKEAGMGYYEPDLHRRAFQSSFAVVFVFHEDRLIGFGRALSDGAYQAAIYDVVVIPEHQGKGIGRVMMENLLQKVAHCNLILYANPGKEGFYSTMGFRLLKTGMAKFLHPEKMEKKGIIK